jgi:hypothetical protein
LGKKRVLIVFYSFTQQTRLLVKKFREGLEGEGVTVALHRLEPVNPYEFPFKKNITLATAMINTFFKRRMAIYPVNPECFREWDCIVLAGPTWSYHPSGPVLSFLDTYGESLCSGQKVIPLISCRSYWRIHFWSIRSCLKRFGAHVDKPIVFTHPIKEPWRLIGLVLQLRGKMMRRENSWFRKHYPGYGHNKAQGIEAMEKGRAMGRKLVLKNDGV